MMTLVPKCDVCGWSSVTGACGRDDCPLRFGAGFEPITAQEADAFIKERRAPPAKDTNPKDVIAGDKLPLWLCSPIAEAHWAMAQYAGMVKYGAWNWRVAGVRQSVYISAIKRHLAKYLSGERNDPADGTHHLGNIMACCAILMDAEAAGKITEDRPPVVDPSPTYAQCGALMPKLRKQYEDKAPHHHTLQDGEPTCF